MSCPEIRKTVSGKRDRRFRAPIIRNPLVIEKSNISQSISAATRATAEQVLLRILVTTWLEKHEKRSERTHKHLGSDS
jgi:hypothetical protein